MGRFSTKQGIPYEDVLKLLDLKELKKFKEQAALYYDEAYKDDFQTAYQKHMRALSAKAYMSRLEELKASISHTLQRMYQGELNEFTAGLSEQFVDSYYQTTYGIQLGTGIGYTSFAQRTPVLLEKAINQKWLGANYSDRIWKHKENLTLALSEIVPQAFILGENPRVFAKKIEQKLDVSYSNAERLARTEFNYIANQGSVDSYNECPFLEQFKYLATLDLKTSELCGAMDGKVFNLDDGKVGINIPPLHPRCRSTTIAWFGDEDVTERIAKGLDGKNYYVPSDMTYEEWKKSIDEKHGEGSFDKSRKMVVNKAKDKEQFDKYKNIFKGDENFPKTLDKFQEMKYNKSKEWNRFKDSKQEKLNSMDFSQIRGLAEKLGDKEVRAWYKFHDENIPNSIDHTKSIEHQARQACGLRNQYKEQARKLMANRKGSQELGITDPIIGFDDLLKRKMEKKKLTRDEAVADILKTATKTRSSVNKKFGLEE